MLRQLELPWSERKYLHFTQSVHLALQLSSKYWGFSISIAVAGVRVPSGIDTEGSCVSSKSDTVVSKLTRED
jgi:hypothetical protein